MIIQIDITDHKAAKEVLDIQLLSYKEEAKLLGYDDIPPLQDTITSLQQCQEMFYGYFLNRELSGVISIKVENTVIDIHRLFVHPLHFKKGIARMLLGYVEKSEKGWGKIVVSTGSKNIPAINFYIKNGFSIAKEIKVNEHLSLTQFSKEIKQ